MKPIYEDIAEKINLPFVKSITFVGSYTNKLLENINDIDVVVIVDKLTKDKFNKLKNALKKYQLNTTFGPLKIKKEGELPPIHLMVYDIEGHKKHCLESPFTVFEWQRSKLFFKQPMTDFWEVTHLQPNYFFNARRNANDYLTDFRKGVISYREYNSRMALIKKYKKISEKDEAHFAYHIMCHISMNFCKMYHGRNAHFDLNSYLKIFNLNKHQHSRFFDSVKDVIKRGMWLVNIEEHIESFIKDFKEQFDSYFSNAQEIIFIRHAKTEMNKKDLFIGQFTDVGIIPVDTIPKIEFDIAYCSMMKRCSETINLFSHEDILFSHNLNEINYGAVDGESYDFLKKNYPDIIKAWELGADPHFPNGENSMDVYRRVNAFFSEAKKDGTLLVCTHLGVLRLLYSLLAKVKRREAYRLFFPHLVPIKILRVEDKYYFDMEVDLIERILHKFRA